MDPNDSLSHTLQAWKVNSPPASPFRAEVWARIRKLGPRAEETWGQYVRSRLALLTFLGTASFVSAGLIGYSAGEARRLKAREALAANYLQSLDPMGPREEIRP